MFYKKFDPEKLSDIYYLDKQISSVESVFESEKNSTVIIYGKHSFCKSAFSTIFFKEIGIQSHFFNPLVSSSIFETIKNLNYKNYNILFNEPANTCSKKYGLIIDNFDIININTLKTETIDFINLNSSKKIIPMIIICNDINCKIVKDLKLNLKEIEAVNFEVDKKNMYETVFRICERKNIRIPYKNVVLLCNSLNYNIKNILNLVYVYSIWFSKTRGDLQDFFFHFTQKHSLKSFNTDILNSIKNLMKNETSIEVINSIYNNDKVLVPLMFHENYFKYIFFKKNRHFSQDDFTALAQISKCFSIGDFIETHIYSDQNWNLQENHRFISCIYTLEIIKNNFLLGDSDVNSIVFNYNSELNKTSLKNINRKNINHIIEISHFKKESLYICNYYVSKIIFDGENIDLLLTLKPFIKKCSKDNIMRFIDLIIKIDKCVECRKLDSSARKRITSFTHNNKEYLKK